MFDNNVLTFEQRAFAFFYILLLKHASSVWSRAKVKEKSILNKLAADSKKKDFIEQTHHSEKEYPSISGQR